MSPQTAPPKGSLFTLVAFVRNPLTIKVIFAMIIIHHFLQFDASSFAASGQLKIDNIIKNTFLGSYFFCIFLYRLVLFTYWSIEKYYLTDVTFTNT